MSPFVRLIPLIAVATLYGSTRQYKVDRIVTHPIRIVAERLAAPTFTLSPALRFIEGWSLSSDDKGFGGLSALSTNGQNFVALSDIGAIVRFSLDAKGRFSRASLAPLPKGCAGETDKSERDSESLVIDAKSNRSWIGLEWRNAICRADAALTATTRLARPEAMRRWPKTIGPEAMVALADGRFLVLAENADGKGVLPPLLVFKGDPTAPEVPPTQLRYAPPEHHFSPTDAAQLPDGRLLVLNRRFEPPVYFSAVLSLVEPLGAAPTRPIAGRTIARFSRPGLTSNFEGVAVSQEQARTFVWLVSDDNFMWIEHTYLLKFELMPTTPAPPKD
jgi:hypothetical protein